MTCGNFAPDELIAARGGACGIPACGECSHYESCMRKLSPGVRAIYAKAKKEALQKGLELDPLPFWWDLV